MGLVRKIFYKPHFVLDKFEKNPFGLKQQLPGYLKSFGEKNPDKFFYVIWCVSGAGFFANLNRILAHIKIAYRLNMIPVVDFENFKNIYSEKETTNGTNNAWEYYFKQISPYDLKEVYQSKRVFFCDGWIVPAAVCEQFPDSDENFLNGVSYKKFCETHLQFQDSVKNELKKYDHFFEQRILGIHFRGKEFNIAQLHPFCPTVEQMFRYTDEILEKYKIEKIFMVTEEKDYLDLFIKKYGEKVLYSNALRVPKINAYNLLNPRPHHRYLLGMEALVDATLLAKCTGMLCGHSNLSGHSLKMGEHEFAYVINNGINHKKWYVARFAFNIKKYLPAKWGGLLDEVTIKERSATPALTY